LNSFH